MAHGYLGDWDEGWGQRERAEGEWRGSDEHRRDHEGRSAFMLGERGRREDRGDWEHAPRDFRSQQDEHYLSWRNKQMDALDRDYAEYRHEREQQFRSEFEEWRRRRHGNPEPLQTGMAQTGMSSDPTAELQLTSDEAVAPPSGPDPMATATLGTQSGRGR